MLNEPNLFRPSVFARRVVAMAAFACASSAGLYAQQADAVPAAIPTVKQLVMPSYKLDFSDVDGVTYSSSVAPLTGPDADSVASLDLKLPGDLQPPPRRRYGRRRYNDSSHNPDGSNKYAFLAGVGLAQPIGNTSHYYNPSYSFQVGAGRNFNKNFSTLVQFDYDHLGLTGNTIGNQSLLYFGALNQGLDGNAHVWSFTVDPSFNFYQHEGIGGYVVGGVGFYHKVTNFTLPATEETYYGFEQVNENVDHYTSNAVGFNGGVGITFKPSRFASEKFYLEARYVFVNNSQRQGFTLANEFTTSYNGFNDFPANSNRTTYIPVKLGVRF